MKYIQEFFGAILFLFFMSCVSVYADDSVLMQEQKDVDQMETVATVNIYNAKLDGQDQNTFYLSFDLSNREYVQPAVRYGVKLIKEESDGSQSIVDNFIFDEVIHLKEQQVTKKEIVYTAPAFLQGEYQLWILANDQNGEMIALSDIGKVVLVGDNQYVEILNNTCYLQINSELDNYTIDQGVSVGEGETLVAFCDVINHFDHDIELTSQFETFLRTRFGKRIDNDSVENVTFKLAAKERKKISFGLPEVREPQAYDSVLHLKNEKQEVVSNTVAMHYVVGGLSATIQNLRLDKISYKKNEEANLDFCWSGPADNYSGSRLGYTKSDNLFFEIAMQNDHGQDCVEKHMQSLGTDVCVSGIVLSLIRDCANPRISVSIKDASGHILDEQTVDFKDDSIQESVATEQEKTYQNTYLLYGYAFAGFLFVVSLGIIFLKRKRLNVWILLVVAGSIICSGAKTAQADFNYYSYDVAAQYGGFWPHQVKVVYSLDKTSYFAGERMTGNVGVESYTCVNSLIDYSLKINLGTGSGSVKNTRSYSYGAYAPSTPGTYTAYFTFTDDRCSSTFYSYCMNDVNNRKGSSFAMLRNGLYVANKASSLNATVDFVQTAFDQAGLTSYSHYVMFGKSEGISPCTLRCSAAGSAGATYAIKYTVIAPPVTTLPPRNCTTPWGSTVNHGSFVVAYFAQSVPNGSICTSERRTCNDGVLSGTAQHPTCVVGPPPMTTYGCSTAMIQNTYQCPGTATNGFPMIKAWTIDDACTPPGECKAYHGGECGTNAIEYEASQRAYFPGGTFCRYGVAVDATGAVIGDPSQMILFPDEGKSVKWRCKNIEKISNFCIAQRKEGAATAVDIDTSDHGVYKEDRP